MRCSRSNSAAHFLQVKLNLPFPASCPSTGSPHKLHALCGLDICLTGKKLLNAGKGNTLGVASKVDSFKFLTMAELVDEWRVTVEHLCRCGSSDNLRSLDVTGEVSDSNFICVHLFKVFFTDRVSSRTVFQVRLWTKPEKNEEKKTNLPSAGYSPTYQRAQKNPQRNWGVRDSMRFPLQIPHWRL